MLLRSSQAVSILNPVFSERLPQSLKHVYFSPRPLSRSAHVHVVSSSLLVKPLPVHAFLEEICFFPIVGPLLSGAEIDQPPNLFLRDFPCPRLLFVVNTRYTGSPLLLPSSVFSKVLARDMFFFPFFYPLSVVCCLSLRSVFLHF